MDQDYIDGLLERYLHLLHDYTSLREELNALQTGMYQNIARANFAAERGVRFGRDYYDDRMQASRRLTINFESRGQDEAQGPSESQTRKNLSALGSIITTIACVPASTVEDSKANVDVEASHPYPEAEAAEQGASKSTDKLAPNAPTPPPQTDMDAQPGRGAGITVERRINDFTLVAKKGTTTSQKSNDPLRWFGLLTPMPLREAQTQSIRAIEHVIPRLASLNSEMAVVEIEVRRARKRRAKSEALARRLPQQSS
ncbi:hypothetical protein GQX73_g2410 [Xylaria multiplex]|uniref:Vacuolar ATPase assembly protein VMA22 n=1 Tax=Xylaria multiplex TaxID=323545 RepID=A0A7C8IX47_9PEZI|nr:hypothetical protein GQX73_g2410 [Xylaria multiplex]